MSEWEFVLTPLLVLPIVLLFRFLGCGNLLSLGDDGAAPAGSPTPLLPPTPPNYRNYIMGEPTNQSGVPFPGVKPDKDNVIAYWRLVDASGTTAAKDEKGFRDGEYVEVSPPLPDEPVFRSEGAQGNFLFLGIGLIKTDPAPCRLFNGGYVRVPDPGQAGVGGLYTDSFTIEAWIDAGWGPGPLVYEHVLFDAADRYIRTSDLPGAPPAFHGFRVYADTANRWQVDIAGSGPVFTSPPLPSLPSVDLASVRHIAVTVQKDPLDYRVRLFVNGEQKAEATRPSYSRPDDLALYIGIGRRQPGDQTPRKPILSMIQEVVLHNKALSAEEIANHVAINK